jgi:hypothetical protein
MSINPGVSQIVDVDSNEMSDKAITQSQTLNPPTPVEYGTAVSGGVQNDATAGDSLPA